MAINFFGSRDGTGVGFADSVQIDKPMPPSFYDELYFTGKKSNWSLPYTQQNFGVFFKNVAKFVVEGFPLARSILDVGCARGFLLDGLFEVARINKFQVDLEGFDSSEFAVENAVPQVKSMIKQATLSTFQFTRSYDLILALDVFEHCSESDLRDFLTKARPFVNDSIFAQIPQPHSPQVYDEPSHITIKPREWWNELFTDCGWQLTPEAKSQTELAMQDPLPRSIPWDVFIFRSGNNAFG